MRTRLIAWFQICYCGVWTFFFFYISTCLMHCSKGVLCFSVSCPLHPIVFSKEPEKYKHGLPKRVGHYWINAQWKSMEGWFSFKVCNGIWTGILWCWKWNEQSPSWECWKGNRKCLQWNAIVAFPYKPILSPCTCVCKASVVCWYQSLCFVCWFCVFLRRDATLRELMNLIKEVNPDAQRRGTVFSFAVVVPNNRRPGFYLKEVGMTEHGRKSPQDTVTLEDLSFHIGDYIDVAIMRESRPMRGGWSGGGDQMW